MTAKFDPNIELPPNMILIAVAVLVLAALGIVTMIITEGAGATKPAPTASL